MTRPGTRFASSARASASDLLLYFAAALGASDRLLRTGRRPLTWGFGGAPGIRTLNLRIKSPQLCH